MVNQRIVISRSGGPETLEIQAYEPPPPLPGEVTIDVHAIGVNFADVWCRLGLYKAAPPRPFTPGFEVAGVIAGMGKDVRGFFPGDRVMAVTRFGAYTTRLNTSAEWTRHLPEGWTFEQGAAFPVAFLTAYHGLVNVGHLASGEIVVIQSAAGGVGTAACQIARALAARIVGTVGSEAKRNVASKAGAGEVVVSRDYRVWGDIAKLSPGGVDIVFDAVGGPGLRAAYESLRPGGRLIVYGFAEMMPRGTRRNWFSLVWKWVRTPCFSPFGMTSRNRALAGFNLAYLWDRQALFSETLRNLEQMARKGEVTPVIGATYPFEHAAAAHAHLQSRRSIGISGR